MELSFCGGAGESLLGELLFFEHGEVCRLG